MPESRRRKKKAKHNQPPALPKRLPDREHETQAPFAIGAYVLRYVGIVGVAFGALEGLKSALEFAPPIDRLSSHWLTLTGLLWRPLFEVWGLPYSPEAGTFAMSLLALYVVSLSALALESRHSPPNTALAKGSRNAAAFLFTRWGERVSRMLIAGSVAAFAMVSLTNVLVFGTSSLATIAAGPWWQWPHHVLALAAVCMVVLVDRPSRLAELIAVGLLCGVLFFCLTLPNAISASRRGVQDAYVYRTTVLSHAFALLPGRIAFALIIASPRFLLAQFLLVVGTTALVIGVCWLASFR